MFKLGDVYQHLYIFSIVKLTQADIFKSNN